MITRKSIDFHGIVTLDKSLVDELKKYLDDKEAALAGVVFYALHPLPPLLQPASAAVLLPQSAPRRRETSSRISVVVQRPRRRNGSGITRGGTKSESRGFRKCAAQPRGSR